MRVAIMQPYFFPYIGYFQLAGRADQFVIYDTIQYTKRGWINRNRILRNGEAVKITLPIARGSHRLDILNRKIADNFKPRKILAQIEGAYRKAPHFEPTMGLLSEVLEAPTSSLFEFLHHGLVKTFAHLGISTPIRIASEIEGGRVHLRGQERVIDICRRLGADEYLNPIGGLELYDRSSFATAGLELGFLKTASFEYTQFGGDFLPGLSIIDVMMFNEVDHIRYLLDTQWDRVAPIR